MNKDELFRIAKLALAKEYERACTEVVLMYYNDHKMLTGLTIPSEPPPCDEDCFCKNELELCVDFVSYVEDIHLDPLKTYQDGRWTD